MAIIKLREETNLRKFMLAMLLVLLPVWASAQGRVFFEPGDRSSGAATECPPVLTSRDGVAHQFLGAALECGWNGTLDWTNSAKTLELELASMPMTSERLIRGWFRMDANVDATVGSKLMRLGYGSPSEIIVVCQFENTPPTILVSVNAQPTYWGGGPSCRAGWHQLEIYQSPTLIRVWQDDVLLREWTGAFNVGSMVTWMSQWSNNPGWEHDATNHVYWQRLEGYTDTGTGGVGSMRDGTMTQGVTPLPTDCVPGTPQLLNSVQDPQCVDGSRRVTEQWTRVGDVPATNGGQACSPIPYSVVTSVPCVVVPPPAQITVITAVKTCRVTIQDVPPDDLGGWGVQFRWNVNNFGSKDSSAPFERERDFGAGSYQLGAIWTKTGETPVYRPTVPYTCQ
jgi:hypothetical protein